jgi:hypothetical protein
MSGGAKRRMRVRSTVGGQVPEFQSLVVAAGQRRSAVGRKRDRLDPCGMSGKNVTEVTKSLCPVKVRGCCIRSRCPKA